MKTGMTFRSDDEYWAWVDRQIRWREKLYKASRYAALMGAAVLLLFALLWFVASHTPPKKPSMWQNAIDSIRFQRG